jgi:hypothetical protein
MVIEAVSQKETGISCARVKCDERGDRCIVFDEESLAMYDVSGTITPCWKICWCRQ